MTGLQGERVSLEAVGPEHAEPLKEMRASPEVVRWWEPAGEGWPLTLEPQVEGLVILVDGEPAGYVQFTEEPDPMAKHADVDIFLARPTRTKASGRMPSARSSGVYSRSAATTASRWARRSRTRGRSTATRRSASERSGRCASPRSATAAASGRTSS